MRLQSHAKMDTLILPNIRLRCILIRFNVLELRNGAKHVRILRENRERIGSDRKTNKDKWSMRGCREKCLSKLELKKMRKSGKKRMN